jgi:hypothetical protein
MQEDKTLLRGIFDSLSAEEQHVSHASPGDKENTASSRALELAVQYRLCTKEAIIRSIDKLDRQLVERP